MNTNIRLLAALATACMILPLCAQGQLKNDTQKNTISLTFGTPPDYEGY